jgi:hypothetical protein
MSDAQHGDNKHLMNPLRLEAAHENAHKDTDNFLVTVSG